MSYSFHLQTTNRPSLAELVERVGLPDLITTPAPASEGTVNIHRTGWSTRPTEITFRNHSIEIRILSLASPEDLELALRIVEQLAALTGGQIQSEEKEPISVDQLRDNHGAAWIRRMAESQLPLLTGWIKTQGKTVSIDGPIRQMHIGPRLYAELEAAGPETELLQRLTNAIRQVQYQDLTGYHEAAIMEVGKGLRRITVSVWSPEQATYFPGSEYLHLMPNPRPDGILMIPYTKLPTIAGAHFSWLDEKQSLVTSVDAERWHDVLGAAEPLHHNPLEQRRKWWNPWS